MPSTLRASAKFKARTFGSEEIQKTIAREIEEEEEGEKWEVEEETEPHPPAQLWHQEGAQQLAKAEPPPEQGGDAALATDLAKPPFVGKRIRAIAYFLLRTSPSTSSHRRPSYGELFHLRALGVL